jgi:hypothetical protein|tara:strand:+ start:493 stop:2337 length:1845 start_codon:yes stop_codon:yes gene_type:complete
MDNFAKICLDNGGKITPLIIPKEYNNGLGLMNPSVLNKDGKIIVNLRAVNYTFYHSEKKLFQHPYGPLTYLHPENDIKLRTWNYYLELDDDNEITRVNKIDTSKFPDQELWDFIGLEDARLFEWEGKFYMSGVRRDTDTIGTGRMEICEIEVDKDSVKQISQWRIPNPPPDNSYCEKNWMPVIDRPYHYIKWSNPTEVVKIDLENKTCETVFIDDKSSGINFRGGSQVVPWKEYYIAITHEVDLTKSETGRKDAIYSHRILLWDKNFKLLKYSEEFSIMGGHVEFCTGLAQKGNDFLMTFGFQDNAAYILQFPEKVFDEILFTEDLSSQEISVNADWKTTNHPTMEFTTSIDVKNGCVVDCVFCPQRTLQESYKGERFLSLENFKKSVDKIPKEVRITFAGFTEPWLNLKCTEMVLYAHEKGHQISIFTTGIGMTIKDLDRIKHIPFAGYPNGNFTLHLPDSERKAKHPITNNYVKLIEYFGELRNDINNFQIMAMGPIHDSVSHVFPTAHSPEMWSRAGNLSREMILKPELLNRANEFKSIYHGEEPKTCGCLEKLYHNVVLPNGDVSLCCMDYGLKHIIGNIFEQSYEEVVPKNNSCFNLCKFCENAVKPNE